MITSAASIALSIPSTSTRGSSFCGSSRVRGVTSPLVSTIPSRSMLTSASTSTRIDWSGAGVTSKAGACLMAIGEGAGEGLIERDVRTGIETGLSNARTATLDVMRNASRVGDGGDANISISISLSVSRCGVDGIGIGEDGGSVKSESNSPRGDCTATVSSEGREGDESGDDGGDDGGRGSSSICMLATRVSGGEVARSDGEWVRVRLRSGVADRWWEIGAWERVLSIWAWGWRDFSAATETGGEGDTLLRGFCARGRGWESATGRTKGMSRSEDVEKDIRREGEEPDRISSISNPMPKSSSSSSSSVAIKRSTDSRQYRDQNS